MASPGPVADVVLLLHVTTTANVADLIEVEGFKLKVVIGVSASYDGVGKLSHYVIEAIRWEGTRLDVATDSSGRG